MGSSIEHYHRTIQFDAVLGGGQFLSFSHHLQSFSYQMGLCAPLFHFLFFRDDFTCLSDVDDFAREFREFPSRGHFGRLGCETSPEVYAQKCTIVREEKRVLGSGIMYQDWFFRGHLGGAGARLFRKPMTHWGCSSSFSLSHLSCLFSTMYTDILDVMRGLVLPTTGGLHPSMSAEEIDFCDVTLNWSPPFLKPLPSITTERDNMSTLVQKHNLIKDHRQQSPKACYRTRFGNVIIAYRDSCISVVIMPFVISSSLPSLFPSQFRTISGPQSSHASTFTR